ncbi:MAG: hypothetical protein IJG24_07900, partial [Selenomonadaceae bacterium]|nr:hypothetical protein [Selenomonadaceae bacterium]
PPITPPPLPKHFSMDAELDNVRYAKELKTYLEEIAAPLTNLPNAEISIHVAINISVPDGVSQEFQDIVTDNCISLGIGSENYHFES